MKQYVDVSKLILEELPYNVIISTMSATAKLNIDMNLENIFEYMNLSYDTIYTIKFRGQIKTLCDKTRKKFEKKKTKSFNNQLTVEIKTDFIKNPDHKISIKIFNNGSIQMSGVKSLQFCNYALNVLIDNVSKEYGIIQDDKIVDIKFVQDSSKFNITNFKIDMINSNFKNDYEITREKLFNILLDQGVKCTYNPSFHAAVNIKFNPTISTKSVSIFVFQSGNIIITGAKNIVHILESYNYITDIFEKYKDKIQKSIISDILFDNMSDDLSKLLEVKDENSLAEIALNNVKLT